MGKLLWTKHEDDQFEEYHPGCMWGVFHALNYHHWHYNARKILPHRKHYGRRHAKGNASPQTRLGVHDSGEMQKLLDTDATEILVNQTSTRTSSNKRSLRARIKALIAEEVSKEDSKRRGSARPQMRRTYSIHHLEPSDYDFGEISIEQKSPTIDACGTKNVLDYLEHNKLSENCNLLPEMCDNQIKTWENQKLGGNASDYQFEDDDVLEIFKVNKKLFLKFLKNTDDGFTNCFNSKVSDRKARLTKSGSFPAADLSKSRNFRPSELKHKDNEIWSHPKGEKLLSGTRAPKLVTSKSGKDLYTKSGPLLQSESGADELNHETCFSSSDSAQELDKRISLFKHIRRTSSLNESVDRYTRLFDHTLSREPKLQVSRSLKLTNEDEIRSRGPASKSSRRIRSLSNLDSYYSLLNEEPCRSNFPSSYAEPKPEAIPTSTVIYASLDTIEETNMVERSGNSPRVENLASSKVRGNDEAIAEADGFGEEMEKVRVGESNSHQEQSRVSVLESCFQDEKGRAVFPIPDDWERLSSCSDEKESSVDTQNRLETGPPSWSCIKENTENLKNDNKSNIKNHRHTEDPDFNFLREILELSGFLKNGYFGTWHTQDQPLDPSVFERVESRTLQEQNIRDFSHHQLIFDMINEVLVQIYDMSFTYYPRALSSTCRVRPMPVGHRVLDDVWTSICGSLSSRPDPEQSLDDIVARDFAKDDSWVNLQLESECLALELEDWIFEELFEELLEEAMCS